MGKRLWVLFVFLLGAAAVVVPVGVLASGNDGGMNHQAFASRSGTTISTASGDFRTIPGLAPLTCSRGVVSATVSVGVTGAPVEFRVAIDEGGALDPGAAHFAPGSTTSFSFTFADTVGPLEASDGHSYAVQWRSPTHQPVTLHRAALVLQYRDPGTCG